MNSLRQMSAFLYRSYCMTRRNFLWFLVWIVYSVVNAFIFVFIGETQGNPALTKALLIGSIVWTHLGAMFDDIAHSITYERWEDTLETTMTAPVSRGLHMMAVGLYSTIRASIQTTSVLLALWVFAPVSLDVTDLTGMLGVLLIASASLVGVGILASVVPLCVPDNGPQMAVILQAMLLFVSGVFYPVTALPAWIQPLSVISPVTHAVNACRKLTGVQYGAKGAVFTERAGFSDVLPELAWLMLLAVVVIPLGLWTFRRAERWIKRIGGLKRSG